MAVSAAHCGEPELVPPKRYQPPNSSRYTSTPCRIAALYATSGTARVLPPWIVPCWYAGSLQTVLKPPPLDSVVSMPQPGKKSPSGPSFQLISPRFVPNGGADVGSQPSTAKQYLAACSSVPPTPVTSGSEAGEDDDLIHELPSHDGCEAPWSPDEAKSVMPFFVALTNVWCHASCNSVPRHMSDSPKLIEMTSPRLCAIA